MIVLSGTEQEAALIFADPSEQRGLRDVIKELDVVFSPHLEENTGADIMISRLKAPAVPALFSQHIADGAFLVQRKTGQDLAASIGERMAVSLARMRAAGARQSQCVLLFVGALTCDSDNNALIDGRPVKLAGHHTYWSIAGSVAKWCERGGVYESVSRSGLVARWLKMKETHLFEFAAQPVKKVYNEPDPLYAVNTSDPLQELQLVRDWRNTLLTIPGLGPKRVEALYQAMQENGSSMDLSTALGWLTTWEIIKKVPGYGKGVYGTVLDWFGLEAGFSLSCIYNETIE